VPESAAMRLTPPALRSIAFGGLLAIAGLAAVAAPSVTPQYDDMRWRLVGPFRGGWATVARGVPGDAATFYFGAADGGVFRTRDAGVTWQPLFNREGSASIGALAVAPSDPKVIWAGTGQIQMRWDVVSGDGVYRSIDGGATWANVGLKDAQHIGAIWVDPRNAGTAVVAALGHVYGPNAERGIFRTEDGGAHWTRVVDRGPEIGAADLAGDPAHPDVLFASLWQVRRHPWLDYFQPAVGAGSGIVRSKDGGASWTPVGSAGLPAAPLGRIELALSPGTEARRVWAAIEAPKGAGLYRSDDGGESWTLVNPDGGLASSYTSGLTPDPKDPETIWAMGRSLSVSHDGGKTFRYAKGSPGGDDYHDLWIDPSDPRRMISAADQGAAITLNGGATWSSWYNQPTGQFYRLGLDDGFPYRIYSGQQDSGTVSIASRSDYGQLTFRDWHPVGADERDADLPDPEDPNIVYGAGLGGRLSRWNRTTGQVQNVTPVPHAPYGARPRPGVDRFAWVTPIAIAPRPPHAIYLGSQWLYRSLDDGRNWTRVSDDLTGADPKAGPCDGDVPVERATACGFATIFAIAPSPAADGVVWMGTSNGRVLLTRDDTKSWADVSPAGIGDWTSINNLDASPTDPATAYVAGDRHRRDELRPIAYRTHDYGAHWTEIGRGLPAGAWVGVVRQDPKRPGLLYAATSRGVWVSFDDGASWRSMQLNLPTTGINDLRVHGDDVVVATQGRALWILDQVAPLRALAGSPSIAPALIPPGVALRIRANQNVDTPLPPEEPRGENPPPGAILDYVLPAGVKGDVTLTIEGPSGQPVRQFTSAAPTVTPEAHAYFTELYLSPGPRLLSTPGHHRFTWNLRYAPPAALTFEYTIAAVPGRATPLEPEGAFVLPGTYRVSLSAGGVSSSQPLEVVMDPRVSTTSEDLAELLDVQLRVGSALARSADTERVRKTAAELLAHALVDPRAKREAREIAAQQKALDGLAATEADRPGPINARLASLETDLEKADAAPVAAQLDALDRCEKALAAYLDKWKAFAAGPYARLEQKLRQAGL